jgi:hypothetical protein
MTDNNWDPGAFLHSNNPVPFSDSLIDPTLKSAQEDRYDNLNFPEYGRPVNRLGVPRRLKYSHPQQDQFSNAYQVCNTSKLFHILNVIIMVH